MNIILMYGSDKDSGITDVLMKTIRTIGRSALYVTAQTVSLIPTDAEEVDFLIIDQSNIKNLYANKGIVLFKDRVAGLMNGFKLPDRFVAVVDPNNSAAIEILQESKLSTITCGISQKNTITFSSIDTDRAIVSLQREIKTLNSETVCPREIPILLNSQRPSYPLLASIAVLLISDMELPDSGISM